MTSTRVLGDIATSEQDPIELCGINQELQWLTSLTCLDGSTPLPDVRLASAARAGSIAGGRCGSMVDRYEIRCPERVYKVAVDIYMCGPTEAF
jgi:hypothetical protein